MRPTSEIQRSNDAQRAHEPRNLPQNSRMWAMLTDVSRQVRWPVDGELQLLSKKDWKVVFSAGLNRHQRIAKGIEGGFVMLGISTSELNKADMAMLIEIMFAFGAEHDVRWTDPTVPPIEVYAEAAR